jgi:4-carboxymuconolactone decarboxylase
MLELSTVLGGEAPYNIFTTLAHHDRLLRLVVDFGGTLLYLGAIPERIREIVIIRAAGLADCEYEYAQHLVLGQKVGLAPEACRALLYPEAVGEFDDDERAVITMTDELFADDMVSDDTWARLARRWNEQQLVELLMLPGYYRMLAGMLKSAGVEIDPGLEGWPT